MVAKVIEPVSQLGTVLTPILEARGLSIRRLSAESGISFSTLWKVIRSRTHVPDLATLAALSQALDLPLATLITACGFDLGLDKAA